MANTVMTLALADASTPIVAGSPRASIERIRDLLRKLNSGHTRPGTNSVIFRTAAVTASATVTAAATVGTNTVTINGVVLTATQHRATGTITCAAADAADNVTVNGVVFVGTTGAVVLGAGTYSVDTGDTAAAVSLAAQINAHASLTGVLTATSALGVVTVRAVDAGTGGNSLTLATTDGTDLAVSGATLTGGAAIGAGEFDFSKNNTETATALTTAINAHASLTGIVTATSSSAVVTVSAGVPGTIGNAITLASSGATVAVSAARLASGTQGAVVTFTF